ncbi:MAG: hypothetical protein OXK79_11305 [Chloroflexota bacterium]|nr:hypothetical protein [Chloroflexota bacterium]
MFPVCGVAVVAGKVPGDVHRLAVGVAENEYVLAGELDACESLPVDSPDVVEGDDPGASVAKVISMP